MKPNKTSLGSLRGPKVQAPNDADYQNARRIRIAFQDEEPNHGTYDTGCDWPDHWYEIGRGMSVGYTSNKWKPKPDMFEDFKHVKEGPQRVFASPSLVRQSGLRRSRDGDAWQRFRATVRMPGVLAELAPILFVEVQLFDSVDAKGGAFRRNDLAKQIAFTQTMLYAGKAGGAPFWAVLSRAKETERAAGRAQDGASVFKEALRWSPAWLNVMGYESPEAEKDILKSVYQGLVQKGLLP